MRSVNLLAAVLAALLVASASAAPPKALKTEFERLSYTFGANYGAYLKDQGVEIDVDLFLQGMNDALEGKELLLSESERKTIVRDYMDKIRVKRQQRDKNRAKRNVKLGQAFLEANKKKKGVVTTASGLQYEVLRPGDGPKAKKTDTVTAHYRGTLIDGTEFDSSYRRAEPFRTRVTGVIPGWTEALQLMNVGSKCRLVIPPNLAYGERGSPPAIGPNETLIFEMELLSIE